MREIIQYLGILLLLLLIAGCESELAEEESSTNVEEYKKVELTFNVDIQPNETMQDSFVSCVGDGQVKVEAYFIEGQSQAVYQKGTYQLTGYSCYNYGTARPCQGTVSDEEAYIPRDLKGIVASIKEENGLYNVGFAVQELPTGDIINVEHLCEGEGAITGIVPDPTVMIQIVLPFALEEWFVVVEEGKPHTATRTAIPLNLNYADITFETTMTTVTNFTASN